MRQSVRRLQDLYIRKPQNNDSQSFSWEPDPDPPKIKGVIQPFGPMTTGGELQVLARQWGDRIAFMKIVFYMGPLTIKNRDGICLDVGPLESCDYRVISVIQMASYQQIVIEFIPEGRRS